MPSRLIRFHESGQTHFLTFSCYQRRPLFAEPVARRIFELALERVRRRFRLCVYGYVVMPEHVHLLISEPAEGTFADAIKSLKQGVSRRLLGSSPLKPKTGLNGASVPGAVDHFWMKRYYDFNVRDQRQFAEKLRYIHRNPVKRGLCERPEDWAWSSFLHYATGIEGRVEIESGWVARKREILPHSSQKKA